MKRKGEAILLLRIRDALRAADFHAHGHVAVGVVPVTLLAVPSRRRVRLRAGVAQRLRRRGASRGNDLRNLPHLQIMTY